MRYCMASYSDWQKVHVKIESLIMALLESILLLLSAVVRKSINKAKRNQCQIKLHVMPIIKDYASHVQIKSKSCASQIQVNCISHVKALIAVCWSLKILGMTVIYVVPRPFQRRVLQKL